MNAKLLIKIELIGDIIIYHLGGISSINQVHIVFQKYFYIQE